MSIPKVGKFHNCNARIEKLYEKGAWENGKYVGQNSIRFISYASVVADYNEDTRTITLYPRWEYSRTTMNQVCRFINECTGTHYFVPELRMFRKIQERDGVCDRNAIGDLFVFSNDFPRG